MAVDASDRHRQKATYLLTYLREQTHRLTGECIKIKIKSGPFDCNLVSYFSI